MPLSATTCGVIASDHQRKPAATLSETAGAEVDYLLARLARFDRRAARDS
jgi:4-hydroxy-tetrahydrodipicolinate synthase